MYYDNLTSPISNLFTQIYIAQNFMTFAEIVKEPFCVDVLMLSQTSTLQYESVN
ncbi:MAG: hypothetical protein HC803_08230 [Saprospiraceae bacterium]|nr:hypothetical protein [Saprospiraceae bacterium]